MLPALALTLAGHTRTRTAHWRRDACEEGDDEASCAFSLHVFLSIADLQVAGLGRRAAAPDLHKTYQRSLLIAGAAERCKSLEQPPPLLASEQYEGH